MGQDAGVVFDVEVVPEDGGHELWQTRIADIGGAAEGTSPPLQKKILQRSKGFVIFAKEY